MRNTWNLPWIAPDTGANLVRWISPRTIKETFAPASSFEYPFVVEK